MSSLRWIVVSVLLVVSGMLAWFGAAAAEPLGLQPVTEMLFVANSTSDTIMLIDPNDGSLVNSAFISDSVHLSTPRQALFDATQERVLVLDQLSDGIFAYDLNGNFIDVFAGKPLTDVLDNMRSMTWHPNGNLLVTLGTSTSPFSQSVVTLAPDGAFLGMFIRNRGGGIESPYDIFIRENDLLLSDSGTDTVKRFSLDGIYSGEFSGVIDRFPQQITTSVSDTILIANFSGDDIGVVEYTNSISGTFLTIYDDIQQQLVAFRGVHSLNNGNLLLGTGSGLYQMPYAGEPLTTTVAGDSSHYIERVTAITNLELAAGVTDQLLPSFTLTQTQQPVEWSFAVTNTGLFTATDVQVVFNLPDTLEYVSDTQACDVVVNPNTMSTVLCTIAEIGPQMSQSFTFTVQALSNSMNVIEAEVTMQEVETDPSNNSAQFEVAVEIVIDTYTTFIPLMRK